MSKRAFEEGEEACKASFADLAQLAGLEYKAPTVRPNGAKMVFATTVPGSTQPEDRICFQMSRSAQKEHLQSCVWDLAKPMEDASNPTRRSLELSVEDPDLAEYLKALDRRNVEEATVHSEVWFKKKMDPNVIESNYQSIFRERVQENYSDSVRIKVNTEDAPDPTDIQVVVHQSGEGEITCRPGSSEDLVKGARVMALVHSSGIWISRYNFGMSLIAKCLLVWPVRRCNGIQAFNLGPGRSLVRE